jgi:hypothetical protein
MSIVLTQEFVSSEEAYITWTIDQSIINPSSKGFLYLTDVTLVDQTVPPSGNAFPITKYQLRFSELSGGSHVFEGLKTGSYIAELSIIIDNTSNTSISSQPITVNVYNLEAPIFNIIVSSDNSFIITLAQPIEPIKNVTFILLGKLIINGELQSLFDNTVTICLPYSAINSYVIGNVVNNRTYEIACFYTDIQGTSSVLSETRIETPTNSPNRIAELAAIYDSVGQTLTITHGMPSNAVDYDLIDCRATITNMVTNAVTYYYSSENSALLVPAPTAADSVVFNMNNQSLLPVDSPFTVTISVKNELGLWGPVESPALYCIHSADYFAVSLVASDLTYSVGLENITTSDNSTYVKNPEYVITYIADVFKCDASGAIVGDAIASKTQDNMNFAFAQLDNGGLYKLVVNLKYDYTFVDTTSATIHEHVANTCFYYFIPHDIPLELNLSAVASDGSVNVRWQPVSYSDLRGFNLDYYEVSSDNATWISTGTATSYSFTELSNGSSNIFYARTVSRSGTSLYMSGIDVFGETANITSVSYGASLAPTLVSQMPGDSKCTVLWTNPAYNGGVFNKFQASVNEGVYVDIVPSFASDQYTFVFESLTNLITTSIQIKIVTSNVSNINNVDTTKSSVPLSVTTIPFAMPAIPASFVASPSTTAVQLNWELVAPVEIINNDVKYELYYKLASGSDFLSSLFSNITTNTCSVTGLTSNLMYDFKIRSSILNDETGITFYSEFTEVIQSRPFVYAFPPVMILVAGNAYIDVILSPNTNNFFNSMFEYSATISDINGNNAKTITLSNISTTNQQTITFSELENGNDLVNLEMYKIVSFYKMLNIDNEKYYSSNTTTNSIEPYNSVLAPVLESVSHDKMISLSLDIAVFNGYDITGYQISFDNVSWADIIMSSTVDLNLFTADITLDQNGVPLVNGSEYHLYARIKYIQNGTNYDSAASNMVTDIPHTTASAPTNVTSEPGNQKVTLSWSAPSNLGGFGLDHYEVKMDNNDWLSVGTVLSHPFTELTNGQTHTFFVLAVTSNVLEDALDNGASASSVNMPYAAASAPIFVSCVESDSQLVLTWDEPDSLGGLTLDHYEVSSDDGLNWVPVGLATSKTFDGLVNGQAYMLRVKAFTTHPYLPALVEGYDFKTAPFYSYKAASAPIFVSCVEGDSQLVVSWTAPSSLGGLTLDHYEVSSDDGLNWVSSGLVTSKTFTGLVNGQAYTLRVKAFTAHPNLPALVEGATLVTDPFYPYKASVPPQNLTSEPDDGTVVFNWTAAEATINGLPFVTNQVSVDNIAWTDISTNTYSLTGANGDALTLYVRFVTEHPNKGLILGENASDTNIPYSAPSKVDSASYYTDITNDNANKQLVFSWGAVPESQLGGLPLDSYAVSKDAGVTWVSAGSNLTYTFLGLTNGQTYLLLAKAVVSHQYEGLIGGSFDSNNAYSDTPYAQSAAPANIVATPGDKSVSFTWDSVTDFGGLDFQFYYISINPEDASEWKESVNNSYSFINLTNGQNYTFTITAITNHPQHGSIIGYTSEVLDIVPYALPAEPVVTAVIGDELIQLSWATPVLGGLTIDHYRLSYNGVDWVNLNTNTDPNVVFVGSAESSSVTFIHLTNGQTYNYYIAAVTAHPFLGLKQGASSSISGIPFGAPGQVFNIEAHAINNYLEFDFIGPDDTNHEVFTQYYEYSIDDSVTFNSLSQLTSFITAIENGPFTLAIKCYIFDPNDLTTKIYGSIQVLTGLQNINVSTPQNLQAEVGDGLITLLWYPVPDTTFQVIQYYSNGSIFKAYTNDTFYTFSGLTNGESYEFGVNMYVNSVAGPVSNLSAIPMSKPIINSVSKSGDNLLLNIDWGGSAKINVNFGAFYVVNNIISGTNVSTVVGAAPVNPITFPGMSAYNYFNVTISNSVGSTSGFYTI